MSQEVDPASFTTPLETSKAVQGGVPRTLAWLERYGVGLVLIAVGIAFGTTAVWARVDDSETWSLGTFLGLLGFGVVLVVLGWLYQIASLWIQRETNALRLVTKKNGQGKP